MHNICCLRPQTRVTCLTPVFVYGMNDFTNKQLFFWSAWYSFIFTFSKVITHLIKIFLHVLNWIKCAVFPKTIIRIFRNALTKASQQFLQKSEKKSLNIMEWVFSFFFFALSVIVVSSSYREESFWIPMHLIFYMQTSAARSLIICLKINCSVIIELLKFNKQQVLPSGLKCRSSLQPAV